MPSTADVFLRLRVDQNQVRRDVDDGLKGVNTGSAGKRAGGQFSNEFGKELNKRAPKHGQSFVENISKAITLKSSLITGGITAALASLPALMAGAGAVAGIALGAGLMVAVIKNINSQEKALTTAIAKLQAKVKAGTATSADKRQLAADQAQLRNLQAQAREYGTVTAALGKLRDTALNVFGKVLTPLIGPFTKALTGMGAWLTRNQGLFRNFFAAVAPYVPIVEHFFENMIKAFLPPLTALLVKAQPAVGHVLNSFVGMTKSGIGGLFHQLGQGVGPSALAFGHLLQVLTPLLPAIGRLAVLAAQLLARFPALIPVLAGVALGLKGMLIVTKVAGAIEGLKAATKVVKDFGIASKLSLLTNPWVLLGVAVVAATVLIIKYWRPISKFFAQVWGAIYNNFVKPVTHWFRDNWIVFAGLPGVIIKYWRPITGFFAGIWRAIYSGFIGPVVNWFTKSLPHAWGVSVNSIHAAWSGVVGFFHAVWSAISGSVLGAVRGIASFLSRSWGAISGGVRGAWNGISRFFALIWGGIEHAFKASLSFITGYLARSWAGIKYYTSVTWGAIRNFLSQVWAFISRTAVSVWNGIARFFQAILTTISRWMSSTWNGIKRVTGAVWNAIRSFFVGTWNGIKNTFTTVVSWLARFLGGAWNGIKRTAASLWGGIKRVFDDFWRGLKWGFTSAVDAVKTIWGKLHDAALIPVRFVVGTVYNKGIVPVVDAIAGVVGLHPLNPVHGFAKGTGGAPPGWAWVGEEGPELVKFRGGEHVLDHQRSMATGLKVPGFAKGTNPPRQQIPTTTPAEAKARQQAVHAANTTPKNNPLADLGNAAVNIVKKGIQGIRALAGDALAAGMNAILNPLLNKIPGGNTKLGQWIIGGIKGLEQSMVNWIKGASEGTVGSGSGASVAAYAKSFATGRNHPYVTGGAGPGGWDCSGFTAYVYDHFGYFPGKQGTRYGTSESQWADNTHLQKSGAVPGALAFFDGTGYAPPGHVGVVINPQQYVSAYDHAEGTVVKNINGSGGRVWGFKIPKGGFHTSGSGPAGGATGSPNANAREGYQYLLSNVFGGSKVAAAGAVASIYGESGWNPYAQGTGGRGLIGWTPPSKISDAVFRGGMRTQLPAIVQFIGQNGDWGVIAQMKRAKSVQQAALEWGHGVERFGVSDVHPFGVRLATQIMNQRAHGGNINEPVYGVGLRSGQSWMFGEQGDERVVRRGGDPLLAEQRKTNALLSRLAAQIATGTAMAIKAPHGQEAQAARTGAR